MSKYPWYEVVEGEDLEQGDILFQCPVLKPAPEWMIDDFQQGEIPTLIEIVDAVVMTQSCDLANEKVTEVLLCGHWDLQQATAYDRTLADKGKRRQILNGQVYRYTFLADSQHPERPMGVRIVDFGYVFTLPKLIVRQLARMQGKRLRLCPPYREHLAQAFARFFMRVGLPQQVQLPEP
jgi:hypothetical protein